MAQFVRRNGAFSFYASPGPIDDLKELAVGAESKGLVIRIAKRHIGRERLSPLIDNHRPFLPCGIFRKGSWRVLNSTFAIS